MATYVDLDTIHVPSSGNRPPASWGAQVNHNFDFTYDEVLAKLGAWTSYTPSLQQSGSVTKTVSYAKYLKLGRTVIVNVQLAVTGSGTGANAILIGLPHLAAYATNMPCGSGYVYDATAGFYGGIALLSDTSRVSILPATSAAGNILGLANMTAALVSGDIVAASFHYESAS